MIMSKEAREVNKNDIIPLEKYSKNRKQLRKDLIPQEKYEKIRKKFRKELLSIKKNRRIPIGPHATFYFENFETMLGQIQEMLHIEKGKMVNIKKCRDGRCKILVQNNQFWIQKKFLWGKF